MIIKPLTNRLFGKENIRQIVREFIENARTEYNQERFAPEKIEHNIEWFEQLYMSSLRKFTTDTKSFFITTVCYKNILNGKEDSNTEEYIALLRHEVEAIFFGRCGEREHRLNFEFESYLCTETIEDLFYKGEIYKHFDRKHFTYYKGLYGNRVDIEENKIEGCEVSLVPQEGNKHLIIPEDWIGNFIKLNKI